MGKRIADVDLIDEIQRLAQKLGHAPTRREMIDQGAYSAKTYERRFGSWNEAVEAAGRTPNPHGSRPVPEETLLDEIRRLADELGHVPTSNEMVAHGNHTYTVYQNRFGSWNEAVEAAGLEPYPIGGQRVPTDNLLDELRRLRDELDRTPSMKDMRTRGRYSAAVYSDRFGSWNTALEEIGAETQEWKGTLPGEPTNDELLDLLQRLAVGLERPPEPEDVATHTDLDPDIYRERWDSWWVACSMAGVTQADLEGVFDAAADAEEAEGES